MFALEWATMGQTKKKHSLSKDQVENLVHIKPPQHRKQTPIPNTQPTKKEIKAIQ